MEEAKFNLVTPVKADEDVQPDISHTSSRGVFQNSAHVVAVSHVECTTSLERDRLLLEHKQERSDQLSNEPEAPRNRPAKCDPPIWHKSLSEVWKDST